MSIRRGRLFQWLPDNLVKRLAWLVVRWLCLGVLMALLYGTVGQRAYPRDTRFGFVFGIMHGALMPLALPSLLAGQDVPIFSAYNDGRLYKVGYIFGINACGFIVFGSLFWKPRRPQLSQ